MNIPKNPAERRVWVIAMLRLAGTSLARLAGHAGVSRQAMAAALATPNSHLEPVIAGALGLTAVQLFPERFDNAGMRLGWTREQQRTTRRPRGNVESEKAA